MQNKKKMFMYLTSTLVFIMSLFFSIYISVLINLDFFISVIILYMDYKVARESLLYASKLGMDNGLYGFIVVELNSLSLEIKLDKPFKWFASVYSVTNKPIHEQAVKKMFPYTLILGVKLGDRRLRQDYKRYTIELKQRIKGPPFCSQYYAGGYAKVTITSL